MYELHFAHGEQGKLQLLYSVIYRDLTLVLGCTRLTTTVLRTKCFQSIKYAI